MDSYGKCLDDAMDIYDLIENYKKSKEKTIRIVCPQYGKDWLIWCVYVGIELVGQFKSMWQSEQFAKELLEQYPGYELEVVSWEKELSSED